jgi:hypothetical protein
MLGCDDVPPGRPHRHFGAIDLRSNSRDGSRRCSRSAGKASSSTSFRIVDRAVPVFGSGIHALAVALLEPEELVSHPFELFDLGVHLSKPSLDECIGVPAGTTAPVAHIEQLLDVTETQAHPLDALDEAQPLGAAVHAQAAADAVRLITEAAQALPRNPQESLLLQALLVRLGSLAT